MRCSYSYNQKYYTMTEIPGTPRTPAKTSSRARRTAPKVESPCSPVPAMRTPKSASRTKTRGRSIPRPRSRNQLSKQPTNEDAALHKYLKIQTSREVAELITLIRASRDMKVLEVKNAACMTRPEFLVLMRQKVPIIFRSYASEWKCVKNWSKGNYLKDAASEEARDFPHRKYRQFTAQMEEAGRVHLTDGKSKAKAVSMEEFIVRAELDESVIGQYLLGIHSVGHASSLLYCPVQVHDEDGGKSPPLARDVPKTIDILSWYGEYLGDLKGDKRSVAYDHQQFFLAKGYAFTDLHYDTYDNFYVATTGTRRWTLACPNASRWSLSSSSGKLKSGSQVIPHKDIFPPGSPAQVYPFAYVDLSPGDILFVPSCWWHLVESLPGENGFSSAFNFFFSKSPEEVYSKFEDDLAKTDAEVNATQTECRANFAKQNDASHLPIHSNPRSQNFRPKRIPQCLWNQLLDLCEKHEISGELRILSDLHDVNAVFEGPSMSTEEVAIPSTNSLVSVPARTKIRTVANVRRNSIIPAVSG